MNLPLAIVTSLHGEGRWRAWLGREFHDDARTDVGFTRNLQFSVDEFRHPSRHGEAETETGKRPLGRSISLMKGVEDGVKLVLLDPGARIGDLELHAGASRRR